MTAGRDGPPANVRLAGRAPQADGRVLLWSVADGGRGRRWRSTMTGTDGETSDSLLVETGPDGRLMRFEAAASVGLMTLHPASDGSILHGNVVAAAGVDHLALPWGREHSLVSFAEPILLAICLGRLARELASGDERRLQVQYIDPVVLDLVPGAIVVERLSPETWRLTDPAGGGDVRAERTVRLDGSGLLELPDEIRWPLER